MTAAAPRYHQDQTAPLGAPDQALRSQESSQRRLLIPVLLLGLVLWFVPAPAGVSADAWHLLAIFLSTLLGIILRPLPMGAMALLGITAATASGVLPLNAALAGFGNGQIWLVVLACFISRGFIKTGLAARLSFVFLRLFGRGPLGIAYGLVLTDLVLAPAIPSNTARAGGIIMPIMRSLAQVLGSRPEDGTAQRIGGYLALTIFHSNVITSAMFITATAANPITVKLAQGAGVEISWLLWTKAALVPGLICALLMPLINLRLCRPTMTDVSEAVSHAHERLRTMGRITREEWLMLVAFVLLLGLWIFGHAFGIDPTQAALLGVGFLLVAGVLTWRDMLAEELAWDVLIWLSVLVTLASNLNTLGLIGWFSQHVVTLVTGTWWPLALAALVAIYFYSHYFFASIIAHVTAMYALFLAVAIAVGAPPLLAALLLGFLSSPFGSLTHYGTGSAPVIFGLRYVSLKAWWGAGAVLSVLYILVWGGIGPLWWKWLGLW